MHALVYPRAGKLGEHQVGPMPGHHQGWAAWDALVYNIRAGDHRSVHASSHWERVCLEDFQAPEFRDVQCLGEATKVHQTNSDDAEDQWRGGIFHKDQHPFNQLLPLHL